MKKQIYFSLILTQEFYFSCAKKKEISTLKFFFHLNYEKKPNIFLDKY